MAGEAEYHFKRFSEDRLDDFGALVEDAFGGEYVREESRKLFDTKGWGSDYVGYLAYDERGEAAAFYGVFPVFVELDGKRFLAAQSGSTMTHSKHRRKNLFYKLALQTFELAKREGIAFVFGFPNVNSYPGLLKLGWTHAGNISSYHIIVPTLPLGIFGAKLKIFRTLQDFLFRIVTNFWRVERRPFPSSAREKGVGCVSRDEVFVGYKKDNPNRFMLEIGGRLVWINYQLGSIGIGDIELADEAKNFKKVLRTLKLICFLTGTIHLRTYVAAGCKLDKLFSRNGYKPRVSLANCYLNLDSELSPEKFKYVYADFDTF